MTGANDSPAFAEMAEMCEQSIRRYAEPFSNIKPRRVLLNDPDGKHSWDKLPHIRRALKHHDYVLWVDADALVIGDQDITPMLGAETIFISGDHNGINCGVMAWRKCSQAFDTLIRMKAARDRLIEHIWFEQAALMELINGISVRKLPKPFFNAYPNDVNESSLILHWPGMSPEERLPLMRERFNDLFIA